MPSRSEFVEHRALLRSVGRRRVYRNVDGKYVGSAPTQWLKYLTTSASLQGVVERGSLTGKTAVHFIQTGFQPWNLLELRMHSHHVQYLLILHAHTAAWHDGSARARVSSLS